MRMGVGQSGMRVGPPGGLDDAGGLAQLACFAQQPSRERSRRHQRRRKPDGFERKCSGAVALMLLSGERARRKEHGALTLIGCTVDQAAVDVSVEPLQRAEPIAG